MVGVVIKFVAGLGNGWMVIRCVLVGTLIGVGLLLLAPGMTFRLPTWAVMASIMTEGWWAVLLLAVAGFAIVSRRMGPRARITAGYLMFCAHMALAVFAVMATPSAVIPIPLTALSIMAFLSMLRTAARHAKLVITDAGD